MVCRSIKSWKYQREREREREQMAHVVITLAIIATSPHVMVTIDASLGGIIKGCYLGDYCAQIFVGIYVPCYFETSKNLSLLVVA